MGPSRHLEEVRIRLTKVTWGKSYGVNTSRLWFRSINSRETRDITERNTPLCHRYVYSPVTVAIAIVVAREVLPSRGWICFEL